MINHIEDFPEVIYVSRLISGKLAKITYPELGLGLACFLSKADSKSWRGLSDECSLSVVKMVKSEAIRLAKRENLKYIHLLSNDFSSPLNHFKISC